VEKIVAVVPIEDVKLLEALEDKIDLEEARASRSNVLAHRRAAFWRVRYSTELGMVRSAVSTAL
jgi:hypothetical protein